MENNMKRVVFLCIIAFVYSVWALDYIEVESPTEVPEFRGNTAEYHNGSDDRHYYYTYEEAENHRWAVKFDFRTYYNNADSTRFAPDSVMIYLPDQTTVGNLNLGLYADNITVPGELVTEIETPGTMLTSGWNIFPLNAAADSVYWLVADYQTNESQTISASNIDGTHSYYWDPLYGTNGSWLNMSASGFNSEFLFGMKGDFILTVDDLEVSDFRVEGDFIAGNTVSLSAKLTNNSSADLNDIQVVFDLIFPGYNLSDTTYIQTLSGGATIDIPEAGAVDYILYSEPGRYTFKVQVEHELDEISSNDDIEIIENVFEFERELLLIENMVELDNDLSNSIWEEQDQLSDELKIINVFPSVMDAPYFSFAAEDRYHYYDIYNLPATVVNGNAHIGYNIGTYIDTIIGMLDVSDNENTFIQITELEAEVDSLDDVHVQVTLERGSHHLSADYYNNCYIKGYIIESDLELTDGVMGTVLLDSIEFASPALSSLASADTLVKTNVFNKMYKFSPLHEEIFDYCSLLFVVQNEDDMIIWEAGELSFSDFGIVSSDNSDIPESPRYSVYPNPFISGNTLTISSSNRSMETGEISVYNLRGQKVRTLPQGRSSWDGLDTSGNPVSTGIYFLKIQNIDHTAIVKVAVFR